MDGRLVSFDVALSCHDRSPFCPSEGLISPRYDDGPGTPISTSAPKFRASMAKPQRTAIRTPAHNRLAGSDRPRIAVDREYSAGPGRNCRASGSADRGNRALSGLARGNHLLPQELAHRRILAQPDGAAVGGSGLGGVFQARMQMRRNGPVWLIVLHDLG